MALQIWLLQAERRRILGLWLIAMLLMMMFLLLLGPLPRFSSSNLDKMLLVGWIPLFQVCIAFLSFKNLIFLFQEGILLIFLLVFEKYQSMIDKDFNLGLISLWVLANINQSSIKIRFFMF